MNTHRADLCREVVYAGLGDPILERVHVVGPFDDQPDPAPNDIPIRTIMSNQLICAHVDLDVISALDIMHRHRLGCLPVVDRRGRPVGVFTKTDVLTQLDDAYQCPLPKLARQLLPRRIGDAMMPLVLSLPEAATICQAAELMALEGIHHVLVTSAGGALVGVVSSMDIVRWLAERGRCERTA